jgi:orotidine-5'-phosphate decarboxylase
MLVVGRPITQSPNPKAAAQSILDEITKATPAPGIGQNKLVKI